MKGESSSSFSDDQHDQNDDIDEFSRDDCGEEDEFEESNQDDAADVMTEGGGEYDAEGDVQMDDDDEEQEGKTEDDKALNS
jgi:hypothetical protein